MKRNLEHLKRHINALKYDIRAEVIVNDMLENNEIDDGQYMIQHEGQFSRAYRFDILESEVTDYDDNSRQMLKINLSRDSFYDMLPENVVHHAKNDISDKGVNTMIREYQIQKKQQKAARIFFQPFENELFSYGVGIENLENRFLSELNSSLAPEILYEFWGIDKDFPPLLISKFISLLPFAYKMVGNLESTCNILSFLLEENVEMSFKGHHQYSDEKQDIVLGLNRMGLDFVIGKSYDDYSNHLDLTIGPLKNSSFTEFIHDGKRKKFLELFCNYFFPMEIEVNTIILLSDTQQKFEFKAEESSVLGYNTKI